MGHQRGPRHEPVLDDGAAAALAGTFHVLSAPSRLRILTVLRGGPRSVGELAAAIGMEQSAVSHQLRLLREAGFVASDRQGRHITYRLYDDHVGELLDQASFHAEHVRLGLQDRVVTT